MSLSKNNNPLEGLNHLEECWSIPKQAHKGGTDRDFDDACHSSNQAARDRRIEPLGYLYLIYPDDEFKSACSVCQLFDRLPGSKHLQNQPDSSVSCCK